MAFTFFDLEKTAQQLAIAYNAAYQLGKQGKTFVAVGTKRRARDLIEAAAKDSGMMYITARWLGGLLTNWEQVKISLKKMLTIEKGLQTGAYDKYTKYERVQLEKELVRLRRSFEGIRDLQNPPDALFVVDINKEDIVIREAASTGTPTIAIVDSNVVPDPVAIPIPLSALIIPWIVALLSRMDSCLSKSSTESAFMAATCIAISVASWRNSSLRATKSVSHCSSTSAAIFPVAWT